MAETRLAVLLVLTSFEGLFCEGPPRDRSNGIFGNLNLSTLAPARTFVAMRTGQAGVLIHSLRGSPANWVTCAYVQYILIHKAAQSHSAVFFVLPFLQKVKHLCPDNLWS